jgi:hypothetical protein
VSTIRFVRLMLMMFVGAAVAACGGGDGGGSKTFALTVGATGTGTVTSAPAGINCGATCTATFAEGTSVVLTAAPGPGQVISAWGGACSGSTATCTVSMSAARSVTVTFAAVPPVMFPLSVTVTGGGSVASQPTGISCGTTCTAQFASGTSVTLTATPASGQILSGWGSACAGNGSTCVVQMTAAQSVTAAFTAPPTPAGWSAAVAISPAGSGAPIVAIDNAGNAIAVWLQVRAGTSVKDLATSRYVPGTGWSTAAFLESDDVADIQQGHTNLAIEPVSGRAIVTWQQFTSATRFDLWARIYDPTSGWGTAARVEDVPDTLGVSRAGIDSNGNAIVVWAQAGTNGRFSLFANRFAVGSGWGARQSLESNEFIGGGDADPRIAVSRSGDAIVVWKMDPGTSGSGNHYWTARYSVASGWGTGSQLVTDAGSNQSFGFQEIVMDGAGNALLAWGQMDGTQLSIRTKRNTAGAWQSDSTAVVSGVNITSAIATPVLAMNGAGVAVISWVQDDYAIRSAVAPAGGAFAAPTAIKVAGPLEVLSLPSVGLDSAGNAFEVWQQKGGVSINDMWIDRYVAGAGWDLASIHVPAISLTVPAVAVAGNGNAVMTWHQFESQGTVAYARYYTAAP